MKNNISCNVPTVVTIVCNEQLMNKYPNYVLHIGIGEHKNTHPIFYLEFEIDYKLFLHH